MKKQQKQQLAYDYAIDILQAAKKGQRIQRQMGHRWQCIRGWDHIHVEHLFQPTVLRVSKFKVVRFIPDDVTETMRFRKREASQSEWETPTKVSKVGVRLGGRVVSWGDLQKGYLCRDEANGQDEWLPCEKEIDLHD